MEKHCELTDSIFEERLKNLTLDPTIFTHEAHIRLAYIYLKKYDSEQAINMTCKRISSFSKFIGREHKYGEKLTITAVKLVSDRIKRSKTSNFSEFMKRFPKLKSDFYLIVRFYSYTSPVAHS